MTRPVALTGPAATAATRRPGRSVRKRPLATGGAPAPDRGAAPGHARRRSRTHLLDYVKVLYKRRWTAMTAFLLVLGSVTVYSFTATPIFEARTRLLIEAENPNVVSSRRCIDEDQTRADYYQTQYNILQSRALARQTLDEPEAVGPAAARRRAGRIGRQPEDGGRPVPRAGSTGLFVDERRADRRECRRPTKRRRSRRRSTRSSSSLTVAPIRNSRLVDVKFRSADPGAGHQHRELAGEELHRAEPRVQVHRVEGSHRLARRAPGGAAEARRGGRSRSCRRYREQNDAISLEDRENIVVQKLADLNAAVTQAKTERIQKEAMYSQLAASQATRRRSTRSRRS